MNDKKLLFLDIESTGLNPYKDSLVGIGYAFDDDPVTISYLYDEENIKSLLLTDALKIGHNINFDLLFLNQNGFKTKGPYFDTRIFFKILDPYAKSGLKDLGLHHKFIATALRLEDICVYKDKGDAIKIGCDNHQGYGYVDAVTFEKYLTQDIELTRNLYKKAIEIGISDYYKNIEQPLIKNILDIELRGIKIDKLKCESLYLDVSKELFIYEKYFEDLKLNPRSPKQIREYWKKNE